MVYISFKLFPSGGIIPFHGIWFADFSSQVIPFPAIQAFESKSFNLSGPQFLHMPNEGIK
jgi:hypothetical protein